MFLCNGIDIEKQYWWQVYQHALLEKLVLQQAVLPWPADF